MKKMIKKGKKGKNENFFFSPNFDFSYGENVAIWSPNESELYCDEFRMQKKNKYDSDEKIRNKRKMFRKMFFCVTKKFSNFFRPLSVVFVFCHRPINRPICPFKNNNQRDGIHRQTVNVGKTNYDVNTINRGLPRQATPAQGGFVSYTQHISADKIRARR